MKIVAESLGGCGSCVDCCCSDESSAGEGMEEDNAEVAEDGVTAAAR